MAWGAVMKKRLPVQSLMDWRITLRPGMVPLSRPGIKVFTSPEAFDGYVRALRALDVVVSFSSPFVANCQATI